MRFISEDCSLCFVTCALKSRCAWDKNTITIIINIRVSSIAPEFPRITSKPQQMVVTRSFALTWVSTDHVKTTTNGCDRNPLRLKIFRSGAILQISNHRSLTIFIQNSNSNLHESSNYFTLHFAFLIFDFSKYSNIRLLQIFNWQLPSVTFYSKNQYVLRIFLGPVKT